MTSIGQAPHGPSIQIACGLPFLTRRSVGSSPRRRLTAHWPPSWAT